MPRPRCASRADGESSGQRELQVTQRHAPQARHQAVEQRFGVEAAEPVGDRRAAERPASPARSGKRRIPARYESGSGCRALTRSSRRPAPDRHRRARQPGPELRRAAAHRSGRRTRLPSSGSTVAGAAACRLRIFTCARRGAMQPVDRNPIDVARGQRRSAAASRSTPPSPSAIPGPSRSRKAALRWRCRDLCAVPP